uniref:Uncharacterized protein n=1 Tax=Spongospora subterranea TaxID=70186 RepID=A0A0H5QZS7_9EUKA|eukprot:CRZ07211.1 hypothetical protein [Spongospora subterranea]
MAYETSFMLPLVRVSSAVEFQMSKILAKGIGWLKHRSHEIDVKLDYPELPTTFVLDLRGLYCEDNDSLFGHERDEIRNEKRNSDLRVAVIRSGRGVPCIHHAESCTHTLPDSCLTDSTPLASRQPSNIYQSP